MGHPSFRNRSGQLFSAASCYLSPGGICSRIWAKVLRFQIATAMPPKATEVAINSPERQKVRRSGTAGASPNWTAETAGERNLRKGMDAGNFIWRTASL